MSMDKKQAARQAAAKYSTSPNMAAIEYGILTKQLDTSKKIDINVFVNEMTEEMLGLLHKYRHPANNRYHEFVIFIDPDPQMQGGGEVHENPEFLPLLKEKKLPVPIIQMIEEYVVEREMTILKLRERNAELTDYKEAIEEAVSIYNENKGETSGVRNKMVVQFLGLSTGNAPKLLNEKRMYRHYIDLVRKKGMRRSEAVEKIAKSHESTTNTVIKMLHDYRRKVLNEWKQKYPEDLPTIKKWLKGFVPSNR